VLWFLVRRLQELRAGALEGTNQYVHSCDVRIPCISRRSIERRMTRRAISCATLLLLGGTGTCPVVAAEPVTIRELKLMNVEDLMNIEVTSAARRPERLLGAGAAIQVVTREQIRRSGATSLPEALRLADNLQVAQRGSRGWAVSARGFNTELANKLLVMIDGRTVYTPLFSGVFWEAQDYLLEDVERIEVISGPGGTLWGANAVNGVINVITRSAADTTGFYAEGGSGPEVPAFAGVRHGARVAPGVHLRGFARYVEHDDALLADGSAAGDSWRRAQAGFRLDAGSATPDGFTLQGDFYDNDQRDPQAGDDTVMRGANLLGRWSRRTSGGSDLRLQTYVDWTLFEDTFPALAVGAIELAPAGRFADDLITLDVDFQHHFRPLATHDLTWGAGFRHTRDKVTNAPPIAFLPATLEQQLFSVFLQDEVRLRDDLSFTAGTKVEHNEYTGVEFEPSVRLNWQAAPAHVLWVAISRAIRAPSRIDRDYRQAAPPGFALLYGNPEFRSEKLLAYELGHRAAGTRVTTSIAAFYNKYDDLRSTTFTPGTLFPLYFENNLVGHTYGVELTAGLQLTENWNVRAAYNLLEERLRVRTGATDIANGLNETADPEQQATLRTALTLPHGVEVDAALRWVDILHTHNGGVPGTVPDYLELEARLGWHVTRRLTLSVVGRNLLDDRHPEYGFPGPARTEVQRSIHGKVAWRH
jgi:iron complex outermembrane receptor protein